MTDIIVSENSRDMQYGGAKASDPAHRFPRARKDPEFRSENAVGPSEVIVSKKNPKLRLHRSPMHGFRWWPVNCGCQLCKAHRTYKKDKNNENS